MVSSRATHFGGVSKGKLFGYVATALAIALTLTLMPLPYWAESARPAWLALLVFHLSAHPRLRLGFGYAWCIGLLLDVIQGGLLGQNAFFFAILGFLARALPRQEKLRMWAMHAFLFTSLLALHWIAVDWITVQAAGRNPDFRSLASLLSSALMLPPFGTALNMLGKRFGCT